MPSAPGTNALWAGSPLYQPRTTWRPVTAVLVTIAVMVLATISSGVIAALIANYSGVASLAIPADIERAIEAGPFGFLLMSQVVLQLFAVIAIVALAGWFGNSTRDVLALHPVKGGLRTYAQSFLVVFGVAIAFSVVLIAASPSGWGRDMRPFLGMASSDYAPLLAFAVVVGAPLSEELIFRGFLLSSLAKTRLGFWGSAVLATGLWTLLHAQQYSLPGLLAVFVLGLTFAWLLWRTGSLWVPIVCHGLYNGLVFLFITAIANGQVTVPGAS
ncbi:MAG: CPBP family intramembrane glutamic endopeptidase [Pseudomonadota bacterium]